MSEFVMIIAFLFTLVANAYLLRSVILLHNEVQFLQQTVYSIEVRIDVLSLKQKYADVFGEEFQAKTTPNYAFNTEDDQQETTTKSYEENEMDIVHNLVKRDSSFEDRFKGWTRVSDFGPNPLKMGRIKPLPSVQYSGDTSGYVLGTHENYNGNGHIRHPHTIYTDWTMDNWGDKFRMEQYFSMDNGIVTVKETGLYLIYAQIFYYDKHDVNGYRVFRNNDTILQCTTSNHTPRGGEKPNTCYTSGLAFLTEDDKIVVRDFSVGRYSLFEPGKSFFGLIKLGDGKPGQNSIV